MRGSVLVLRERWPSIAITEAHPKALLRVSAEAQGFVSKHHFRTQHERDAALGAFAALAFEERRVGWQDWLARERVAFFPSGSAVSYWFPSDDSTRPVVLTA